MFRLLIFYRQGNGCISFFFVRRGIYGAHALQLHDLGTTKLHSVGLSQFQRRKAHVMPLRNVDRASHRR